MTSPVLTVKELQAMIKQVRIDAAWIYEDMPTLAITEGQKQLEQKHGTPYNFALGLVNSIGEISILEAQQEAEKYRRKWLSTK